MDTINELFHQVKNIEYIRSTYGKEPWVQVAGHKELNGADAGFWACLTNTKDLKQICSDPRWDSHIGTQIPYLAECDNGQMKYERISRDGIYCENIVNCRDFYGIKPNYVEVSEEFRFLNNLYHDTKLNIFYAINDSGTCDEVAKIENNSDVFIKLKYLVKYATAKQMALLLFFDIKQKIPGTLEKLSLQKFSDNFADKNLIYRINGSSIPGSGYVFSLLMGKRIILPRPIEECGYYPFEEKDEYLEFIIETDEYGDNKYFTSDPDKLSNKFGANPNAPNYLTPVFFNKEVLHKYISHPEIYDIADGYLSCGSLWCLRLDNHHKDRVTVYLGDLGTYLPFEEQKHWKTYNIVPTGTISDVKFLRDFCGISAAAKVSDLKFKNDFSYFQKQWYDKFGWYFFLPLTTDDKYNFNKIHIPVLNNQSEFDDLVLSLVKTTIDSINGKEILMLLKDPLETNGEKLKGSISVAERWFEENNLAEYATHIDFLRHLQNLRSSATGHRKGNNYKKIAEWFSLDTENYINVFDTILEKTNLFLVWLTKNFLEQPAI